MKILREDEIGGTGSMHGIGDKHKIVVRKNLKEEPNMHGKIITV
jgi:hypothetical protein